MLLTWGPKAKCNRFGEHTAVSAAVLLKHRFLSWQDHLAVPIALPRSFKVLPILTAATSPTVALQGPGPSSGGQTSSRGLPLGLAHSPLFEAPPVLVVPPAFSTPITFSSS